MFAFKTLQLFGLALQSALDLGSFAFDLSSEGLSFAEARNHALFLLVVAGDLLSHAFVEITLVSKLFLEVAVNSLLERTGFFKLALELVGLTFLVRHSQTEGSFLMGRRF